MLEPPQVHNLASGSSANCMIVRYGGTTGLIDCGLPIRRLTESLRALGVETREIDFVFVTHEHIDHVRSLPQLSRAGATIITGKGTALALRLPSNGYVQALPGKTRSAAGIDLTPIAVSHDASEPLGVMLGLGDTTVTVLTDLGCVTENLYEPIAASDVLVIESNHDLEMLRTGPYPAYLKRRVMSKHGHLSNADCGHALRAVALSRNQLRMVWLAHLSETNNVPDVARSAVGPSLPTIPVAPLARHDTVNVLNEPDLDPLQLPPVQRSLWAG